MPQPVRPARVQVGAPVRTCRGTRYPVRVVAPEVQPIWGLVEGTVQSDLEDDDPVRVVVAAERGDPAQDVCPDDAVLVVCPDDAVVVRPDEAVAVTVVAFEQPLLPNRMLRKRSGALRESVASGYSSACVTLPVAVDRRCPGVGENYVPVLVECVDAAL